MQGANGFMPSQPSSLASAVCQNNGTKRYDLKQEGNHLDSRWCKWRKDSIT